MIKAKVNWRRGHLRYELRGRNTNPAEAATLIAGIYSGVEAKCPGTTAEELLNAAKVALEAMREEDEKGKGLKVKCYKQPADGCEYIRDGDWCSRFGCDCADVHIDEEKEDE